MFFVFFLLMVIAGVGWYFFNENYIYPQRMISANEHMRSANFDDALKIINALPEKKKSYPEIQFMFYEIFLQQKQFFMALYHLNEIIKKESYPPNMKEADIRLLIAEVFEKMEKKKKALAEYYNIVESVDPDNISANKKAGLILYSLRNYGAAEPFLEKAFQNSPADSEIAKSYSEICYINKNYQKTYDIIQNLMTQTENDEPELNYLRAKALYRLEKYEECIADTEIAKSDPMVKEQATLIQGIALYKISKYDQAEELLSSTLTLFAEDFQSLVLEARYYYSHILSRKGRIRDALRQLNIIKNSGKELLDVSNEVDLYEKITNSKYLIEAYNAPLTSFIEGRFARGISQNGHVISSFRLFGDKRAVVVTRKNTASGQAFYIAVVIDISMEGLIINFAKDALSFIQKNEVTSGYFLSIVDVPIGVKDVFSGANINMTVLDPLSIDKVLGGEKTL